MRIDDLLTFLARHGAQPRYRVLPAQLVVYSRT
jgi:hypothetical protein